MIPALVYDMTRPHWLIIVAGIISSILAVVAATMYPLNRQDILSIVLYEVVLFFGLFPLLYLIYKKGLPH